MSQVFSLDGATFQVQWHGTVLPTTFNSKGAALAYLAGLKAGRSPS